MTPRIQYPEAIRSLLLAADALDSVALWRMKKTTFVRHHHYTSSTVPFKIELKHLIIFNEQTRYELEC